MYCIKCDYEQTRVQNSERKFGCSFRTRMCLSCGFRFRTKEVFEREVKTNKIRKEGKASEIQDFSLNINL